MAYKYDPILRMNVPVMTTDGYKVKATGKADTLEEAKKFLSKQGKNIEHSRARKSGSKYYFDNAIGDDVGEWDSSSKVVKAYDEIPNIRGNKSKVWSVGYQLNGVRVTQSIGVIAESADEAIKKAEEHLSKKGWVHIFGASQSESLETMKRKGKPIIDEKTWDNAIQAADASRIIEQKNGYTLGINSQGTICLAFPGETINNPHMYLGKENEKNLADAKILFMEFAR